MDLKNEIEIRANAYIEKRIASSGVPFPFVGVHRELCMKLMAAFACEEIAAALTDVFMLPSSETHSK
jgi:hypothetical protein